MGFQISCVADYLLQGYFSTVTVLLQFRYLQCVSRLQIFYHAKWQDLARIIPFTVVLPNQGPAIKIKCLRGSEAEPG